MDPPITDIGIKVGQPPNNNNRQINGEKNWLKSDKSDKSNKAIIF